MKQRKNLGIFAVQQSSSTLSFIQNGEPVTEITAYKTVISGAFEQARKGQIARIVKIVDQTMINGKDDKGNPAYVFTNTRWDWSPAGTLGAYILEDVKYTSPEKHDIWACKPEEFTWKSFQAEGGETHYSKDKIPPQWVITVPTGTVVNSAENRQVIEDGDLVVCTDPDKGDWYVWKKEMINEEVTFVTEN